MSDNAEKDAPPVYGCCQHCTDYDAGEEWCTRAPHDDACVQPYCSGGRADVRPGQPWNALPGDHGQPETAHRPQVPTEVTMRTHALTPGSATAAAELPVVDADEAKALGYLGGVDDRGDRVWYGLVPMNARVQVRDRDGNLLDDAVVKAQRYSVVAAQPTIS